MLSASTAPAGTARVAARIRASVNYLAGPSAKPRHLPSASRSPAPSSPQPSPHASPLAAPTSPAATPHVTTGNRGSTPAAAAPAASTGAGAGGPPGAMEVATLGGGCFWCIEACYNMMRGVESAVSGYAAGQTDNPTYKEICSGRTGHAEVVQITYDPSIVSFKDILEIFFTLHDPTTKDRQGNDVGTQYRSIILYHNEQQKAEAEEVMAKVSSEGWWSAPLVTQLEPLPRFYPAEDYHQRYFEANPGQGYCRAVVGPKVAKFRAKFAKLIK